MSYEGVLARLRAYPPKALHTGMFRLGDRCCSLGAAVPSLRTVSIPTLTGVKHYRPDVFRDVLATGMDEEEAYDLLIENDSFIGRSDERYAHVVGWLEAQVGT